VLLGAGANPSVDFDTQILPILTKAGCNAGACHGSATGRGGFKLSLYGSDPASDYQAIARQWEGRRINLAFPERSLLVLKPTEQMEHGGGGRLDADGRGAARLLEWIEAGAPRAATRRLTHFDVSPSSHVVSVLREVVPLRATAHFSDRSIEDVTEWTVFTAEDSASLEVDQTTAVARLLRRGRHIVLARYLDRVVPIQLLVPLAQEPVDLSGEPRQNFVDELVYEMLETLRLPVSPLADDATFLRRAYLDLTGILPEPDALEAFRAESHPDKRRQLVHRLLETAEFADYWTYQFAKLLRIRSEPQDTEGARTYHDWLRRQIETGVPYDDMARELLTAVGDTHQFGPANFYRTVGDARDQAELVSELFLAVRLRCANCHNHPLDRWTQDDYHGLAAVFANIERGRVIAISEGGEVTHPRTGQAALARIPGERFLHGETDGRQSLALWLTHRENPYFARAVVNRLWKSLMGRGLVEPTDDMRATNPATHPELLERLADDFAQHQYDLRHTMELIGTSATYARSAQTVAANRTDDRYYSHALVRPLEPEVLADAIAQITGVSDRYGNEPEGTRAVTLYDSKITSEALDILGRCSREASCESVSGAQGGLSRTLHMINGELINRKITAADSRLEKLLAAGRSGPEIVEEFYLRGLGRSPTADERSYWTEQFAGATSAEHKRELAEDFVWSLLSCREFATNH
jgi:hypothetical protein